MHLISVYIYTDYSYFLFVEQYRYALQLERITLLITEGNYNEHAHHSTVMYV